MSLYRTPPGCVHSNLSVLGPAPTYNITVHFQLTHTYATLRMYGLPWGIALRTLNMDFIYI